MKNLFKTTIGFGLTALFLGGCNSSVDTGPVESAIEDVSGVYRTDSSSGVPSVTSIEIMNGQSASDLEAVILRNGLSDAEYTYFNDLNEVQFVDSRLGREIDLKNFKKGLDSKNDLVGDLSLVNVCSDKLALNSKSMDLEYCLYLIRQNGSLKATGELVLNIFEFGEKVHEIKTPFTVFTKDRWFVDFYGDWSGEISFRNGNAGGLSLETGQNLKVTFQPVTETQFILRPLDSNHYIHYAGERYILMPQTREMVELEDNANTYINFVYVSEIDGVRQVHFNSYMSKTGLIEGNITAMDIDDSVITLGTYSLEQE